MTDLGTHDIAQNVMVGIRAKYIRFHALSTERMRPLTALPLSYNAEGWWVGTGYVNGVSGSRAWGVAASSLSKGYSKERKPAASYYSYSGRSRCSRAFYHEQ